MKRTPVDMEVYTIDICKKVGHERCPGIGTLSVGKLKLGPVACICYHHKVPSPRPTSKKHHSLNRDH
jgi:hypothetical protein